METKDNLVLKADLPGLSRDDIEIDVEGNELRIRGERTFKTEETDEQTNIRRRERAYGMFERTFVLPDTFEATDVTATYTDGVLTVTVPRAASTKPRRVTVDVG